MDLERPKLIINGTDHSVVLVWAILAIGVVMFLFPRSPWWRRSSKEPSGFRLLRTRAYGLILILLMAYMLAHEGRLVIPGLY